MYNLAAVHDVNTGIILTTLTIAYLKNLKAAEGLAALAVFILSILPTPLHGSGMGAAALLVTYIYLYRIWGKDREITLLVLAALLLMMVNIVLGLRLRGIF